MTELTFLCKQSLYLAVHAFKLSDTSYISISRMHADMHVFKFFLMLIVYLTSSSRWMARHSTLLQPLQDTSWLFWAFLKLLSLYYSERLQRSVFGPRRRRWPRHGAVPDPAVRLRYRVRRQRVGLPDECGELAAKQLPRWHPFTRLNSFKQISVPKSYQEIIPAE